MVCVYVLPINNVRISCDADVTPYTGEKALFVDKRSDAASWFCAESLIYRQFCSTWCFAGQNSERSSQRNSRKKRMKLPFDVQGKDEQIALVGHPVSDRRAAARVHVSRACGAQISQSLNRVLPWRQCSFLKLLDLPPRFLCQILSFDCVCAQIGGKQRKTTVRRENRALM